MRASIFLSLLALSACSSPRGDVALRPFGSCDEMSGYMQEMAYREVRFDWREAFDLGLGGLGGGRDEMGFSNDSDAGAPQAADSYSTTNLQEAGVDEADLVKTDGTHLFSVAGGQLVISRVFPVEEAAQLAAVRIDGQVHGLYLLDGQVIALSKLYWQAPSPRSGVAADWQPGQDTVITVIDVADPAAPEVVRETYATGTLETSRRIGDQLYVVTYRDVEVGSYANSRAEARDAVAAAGDEDWRSRTLDNRRTGQEWTAETGPACGCEDTYASEAEGGTYITTVLALDLSDTLSAFRGQAVVGHAEVVYSSPNAMYVAYSEWEEGPWGVGGERSSIIHKFDLGGGDPTYVATAEVPGTLHDAFSLSEQGEVLRVATTETDDDWQSSNGVYTLSEQGGVFSELDRIEDLAPGEQVMSARFIGDIGYVVTWEAFFGDPLFTFDLSDPSDISVEGELHIPGWSDYLHPMDEEHLIAVGMESGSLQVSIFDVSDLSDPQLSHRLALDAGGSEAQWDHHAFNYFAPTESLSLPSYTWGGEVALEVVHATTDQLSSYGRLSQPASFLEEGQEWCGAIRRSVVMDDVVWAVSSGGLSAALVEDPSALVAAVPFSGVDPCEEYYYDERW
ncbi:MAG: beta-propeller domain-containing protein [Deltaproteobacteria bacterium]|nr:beta-propeller domain-containing protein [Deltaproteobacteria bacterium]